MLLIPITRRKCNVPKEQRLEKMKNPLSSAHRYQQRVPIALRTQHEPIVCPVVDFCYNEYTNVDSKCIFDSNALDAAHFSFRLSALLIGFVRQFCVFYTYLCAVSTVFLWLIHQPASKSIHFVVFVVQKITRELVTMIRFGLSHFLHQIE